MPHSIFNIDELLRLVVDELVKTSQESAVSFALACRSFEEPTLSSLWKKPPLLHDLVVVLPSARFIANSNGVKKAVSDSGTPGTISVTISSSGLRVILQRRTGPGYDDTLPGCVNYLSVSGTPAPVLLPGSRVVHPMGSCSPIWNRYAETSMQETSPFLSSVSSSPLVCGVSASTTAQIAVASFRIRLRWLSKLSPFCRLLLKIWTLRVAREHTHLSRLSRGNYVPFCVNVSLR